MESTHLVFRKIAAIVFAVRCFFSKSDRRPVGWH